MLKSILLFTQFASAGTPAYYSPMQIMKESALFAQSAEQSAPKMQAHQRDMRAINKNLIELSLNAELLGLTDPAHWSQTERTQIKRTFYESNTFIDAIQLDYNRVYLDSMNKALMAYQSTHSIEECSISRVDQMAGKSAQCTGVNLSLELVKAMDADQSLIAALNEIEARPWPTLKAPDSQMELTPITGSKYSINPSKLATALLSEELDSIKEAFEDAIAPIESEIDRGSQEAIEKAKAFRKEYETQMFELGTKLTAATQMALTKSAKKDKKWSEIGYCAQPEAFGGCGAQDVTSEVVSLIKNNKKAIKSLQ